MAFETERAAYHANLEDLLVHEGKFVVIKGETVAGTRDTYEQVLELGYERFGLVPFLVKKIRPTEPVRFTNGYQRIASR